ncbi:uncharacterized protein LOC114662164 [Erpetoichthys calabaricus]|uniref:uncharacterized protein LOC114662164 n=1 Tax=Erpetoichthys calabaricus TaxID=27687 RepID=UPI0022346DA2|nr:uncharacterized protein LOC114662164 [Erpetoichthys calabaricus]
MGIARQQTSPRTGFSRLKDSVTSTQSPSHQTTSQVTYRTSTASLKGLLIYSSLPSSVHTADKGSTLSAAGSWTGVCAGRSQPWLQLLCPLSPEREKLEEMRRSSRSTDFQNKTSTDRRPPARSRSGPSAPSWSANEVLAVTLALLALFYVCVHHHSFHLHVTRLYAALGHPQAQHLLGQRYLTGVGVEQDSQRAMEWFRRAAEQGHPHSAYNLALGILRNLTATQQSREVERFLLHAAANGIPEAYSVLEQLDSDPEYS